MTGVVWEIAKTGVTTDESSEEEKESSNGKEKVMGESDRKLGCGPYAEFTYEQVLHTKPGYVEFLAVGREEG